MPGHPFAVIEPPMTGALFTSGAGRGKSRCVDFARIGVFWPLV
jgi:hypothetical protein